jgi:aminoglycoside phosphotransferase (APT) family kinase protein
MEFRRRRPTAASLAWVEAQLGAGARVVRWRRLTGGLGSSVHRLTVERRGRRQAVVLRQYEGDHESGELVEREARALRELALTAVPAPELLAASVTGAEADGRPSLLMTKLAGRLDLTPDDPDRWLGQMAAAAAAIHDLDLAFPPFEPWFRIDRLRVPGTATRPALWREVHRVLQEPAPAAVPRFLHRDFQHFNLLWSRGRLRGVVDWTFASRGPAAVDVGHCRLNLAVLFSADRAERLRLAYEAETGHPLDPWWDLLASASYGDHWPQSIPIQVHGRAPVDSAGMTARVEELLEATLARL